MAKSKLSKLLDEKIFTDYYQQKDLILQIAQDDNLDLNEHRDIIKRMAMFTLVETMTYWNKMEKTKK